MFLLLLPVASFAARPAHAQGLQEDPAARAAMHLGPVALTPTFAVRNIGVDTNVFNSPEAERDFTMTMGPAVDAWWRIGRLRLTTGTDVQWDYFRRASSQRSFNFEQTGKLELLTSYVVPFISGRYDRNRRRPNLEIDARVEQVTTGSAAGLRITPGSRSAIDIERYRDRVDFDEDELGGNRLANALNRETTGTAVAVRYGLSSLTTFVTTVRLSEDRFDVSPLRNSDSLTVLPGLEFRPFALISGTATVGYRSFDALDERLPDFSGLVADVDLKYVARDMTRIVAKVTRDVEYSFELAEPYFVATGWNLEFTQAISYSWDATARIGRTRLAYEALTGVEFPVLPARTDRVRTFGAGIGRRFGIELRLGIDVDYVERVSEVPGRTYEGWRVGGSVTYGY